MDERLLDVAGRDARRLNLSPRTRTRLIARYRLSNG
jgi:hypothetical protein